jgi:hypothetical protein
MHKYFFHFYNHSFHASLNAQNAVKFYLFLALSEFILYSLSVVIAADYKSYGGEWATPIYMNKHFIKPNCISRKME